MYIDALLVLCAQLTRDLLAIAKFLFYIIWRWIIRDLKSGLELLKIIQTGTTRKLGCGFLFAFHSNYGHILHHFRDKGRYWSKIVIFFIPQHSTPPLGGSPSEYWEVYSPKCITIPFGVEKRAATRRCKNVENICNRLDRIPACDRQRQTDRQMDRRADILPRHSPRYVHASRANDSIYFNKRPKYSNSGVGWAWYGLH